MNPSIVIALLEEAASTIEGGGEVHSDHFAEAFREAAAILALEFGG